MDTTLIMLGIFASPVLAFIAILGIQTMTKDVDYEYETDKTEPKQAQLPKGQNVIDMRDAEALAYISKHPAMNAHRSRA